jgi:peptidoglycan/LPS O-acetylase OafA/YrhL
MIVTVATSNRLAFLDGLRGIAISAVLLFHIFARWPNFYPYGDKYLNFPVFAYGWLGVYLFFIISGFVIFMTLERCVNFREFILRRWLRLFPAMLICSLLIFLSAPWFPERPAGSPTWRDILPGLTLIDPIWWGKILGSPQGLLEGAFWSIFVEVKFYFLFGALYFLVGGQRAVCALTAVFLLWATCHTLGQLQGGHVDVVAKILNATTGAENFGWFVAGALLYMGYAKRDNRYWALAVLASAIASNFLHREAVESRQVALILPVFLLLPLMSSVAARILSNRALVFMGFLSYPFYLIHENLTVALIVKSHTWISAVPGFLLPVPSVLAVGTIAWIIAEKAEPLLRRWFTRPLKPYLAVRRQLPE